jgi:hypothetical protein
MNASPIHDINSSRHQAFALKPRDGLCRRRCTDLQRLRNISYRHLMATRQKL